MITIQILAETEYQDLYRVTDGVLLVVNKFIPMGIEGEKYPRVYWDDRSNSRVYDKGCQKELKKLIKDYEHKFEPKWKLSKGTVLYNGRPVVATKNEEDFKYELKTTGSSFSGNSYGIKRMLNDILYQIKLTEDDTR